MNKYKVKCMDCIYKKDIGYGVLACTRQNEKGEIIAPIMQLTGCKHFIDSVERLFK